MSLADLQYRFHNLLLSRVSECVPEDAPDIQSINDQEKKARWNIYQQDVRWRFEDALAMDFTLTKRFVENFEELAENYFLSCPSTSYTLNDYGRSFAKFLKTRNFDIRIIQLAEWEWKHCELLWENFYLEDKFLIEKQLIKINKTLSFFKSHLIFEELELLKTLPLINNKYNFYVLFRNSNGIMSLSFEESHYNLLKSIFENQSWEKAIASLSQNDSYTLNEEMITEAFSIYRKEEIISL
jgi:hypothetical protein